MSHGTFKPADIIAHARSMVSADRRWTRLLEQAPSLHLAILVEPFLTYILDGRKTIESRFTRNRVAPFERVRAGDLVLLKRSSGPVVGMMCVERVEFLVLDKETWPHVRSLAKQLCADDEFWVTRTDKRYASLIYIRNVRALSPFQVQKIDRRGWVVLHDSKQLELGQPCA